MRCGKCTLELQNAVLKHTLSRTARWLLSEGPGYRATDGLLPSCTHYTERRKSFQAVWISAQDKRKPRFIFSALPRYAALPALWLPDE